MAELAYPVLHYRVAPIFNTKAEGITVDEIIRRLVEEVQRSEAQKII